MTKESSMEFWHMVNDVPERRLEQGRADGGVLMRWPPHDLFHLMQRKVSRMLFRLGRPHTS